jgi:hypothetical protein
MKRVDLIEVKHNRKIGEACDYIEPNITEDCIFYADGDPIGFYLTKMPEKMCKLADLANAEFNSKKVPKVKTFRNSTINIAKKHKISCQKAVKLFPEECVEQMSTIIGGVALNRQMGRYYNNLSSVHSVKTAQTFIKAMLLLAKESELLIKEILPKQYQKQVELFKQVPDKCKFGNLFTSSISNFNISAPFHRDTGNIQNTVNVIICKRLNSKGGDLHVPDYNATIGQVDNSILVYPAWRNMHGVTPIIPTFKDGYRNSLVFYPLKAFVGLEFKTDKKQE